MSNYKFTPFRIMLSKEHVEDLEIFTTLESITKIDIDEKWIKFLDGIVADELAEAWNNRLKENADKENKGYATDEVKGIYDV